MDIELKMVIGLLVVLIILFFYFESKKSSLNKFKDIRVGHGQHGNANWANKKEITKTYKKVKFDVKTWRTDESSRENLPEGIVFGLEKTFRTKKALIDTTDSNTLMIGPAGIGKTFFYLLPNLEYTAATGASFVVTDTKGEIYQSINNILRKYYNYKVILIDLRNPLHSEKYNIMQLVNKYMDLSNESINTAQKIVYEAKAQKYAKIISKSIITASMTGKENSYFYDNAEGLLTSAILLIAEYAEKDQRHIINVFKFLQELSGESKEQKNTTKYKDFINILPANHKAKWFAGATVDADIKAALSIFSTSLSRLTKFIDTELEQILCFDSDFTAERFVKEKTAVFFVLPEEDTTKHFLFSLFIMQLYRELLIIADTKDNKKLEKRVMFFEDEFGTLPAIQDIDMAFSASRSRNVFSIPMIQSVAQLEKKYGKESARIISDNCQNTIFSGFAPISETPEILSKAMGTFTVQTGSVSNSENNNQTSKQMMSRELMTADEIKRIPKGEFIVLKTGKNPMKAKIPLFKEWGIELDNSNSVQIEEIKKPNYLSIDTLKEKIKKHYNILEDKKESNNTDKNIFIKKNETEVETKIQDDKKTTDNNIDKKDNFYDF